MKNDALKDFNDKESFKIIAGPCVIESMESLNHIAQELIKLGVRFLRGGAFKMRSSPDSFRGLGKQGLEFLRDIGEMYGLYTVSECTEVNLVELLNDYVDVIQVGTRNMHNYPLLEELGKLRKPIILKRGMSATFQEWIMAAEYIRKSGNEQVIMCERGIRTFETYTRNTLDLSSVPAIKSITDLPVIVDPSHATGRREMVKAMTWAAVASGADGVMIETHGFPEMSKCDAQQSVSLDDLKEILSPIEKIRMAIR